MERKKKKNITYVKLGFKIKQKGDLLFYNYYLRARIKIALQM